MSLESMVSAPASTGQETATNDAPSNDLDTRFEGITDLDAPELETAPPADEPSTANNEELPAEGEVIEPDQWEGYEDFEIDGEVVKLPSKYKDGYLRLADYTRKTQEVAETRKQLEAREQEITKKFQQTEDEFQAHVILNNLDNTLAEFHQIDWAAEAAKLDGDFIGKQDLQTKWMQYQDLLGKRSQVEQFTKQKAIERDQMAQQETAKRLQATRHFAETKIKGWTPQVDAQLQEFATKELGFDENTLMNAYTPAVYRALYGAFRWEESLKRQSSAKPSPTSPPPAPTKTVSAKANPQASKDLSEMSEAEFFAKREADHARRR